MSTIESEITITPASESDVEDVKRLLSESGLPLAGLDDHWPTFVVARERGRIVGCGGAESYAPAALIRSIAVADSHRSTGIGRQIVRQLLDRLASRGIREFYLLTTTAESYFVKRGFRTISRDEVPPTLLASEEFRGACPASAVCMRLVMMS